MQVFICEKSPIKVCEAMKLDRVRMNKQVIEARQIIKSIEGLSKSWKNHPVCLMYKKHKEWLYDYMCCMDCYLKGLYEYAKYWSDEADKIRPSFLDWDELIIQHRKRLYSKSPDKYPQFAQYGTSDINYYVVNGELLKYKDGKRIK